MMDVEQKLAIVKKALEYYAYQPEPHTYDWGDKARKALEQIITSGDAASTWFVESVVNSKSEGWWTQPPMGIGGWLTQDPLRAKRFTKGEAEAVAAALNYFLAPFRWSGWVATEHVFMDTPPARECTCPPDEAPTPCSSQYALSACWKAALKRSLDTNALLVNERNNLKSRVEELRDRGYESAIAEIKHEYAIKKFGTDAIVDHVFKGLKEDPPRCEVCRGLFIQHARVPANMLIVVDEPCVDDPEIRAPQQLKRKCWNCGSTKEPCYDGGTPWCTDCGVVDNPSTNRDIMLNQQTAQPPPRPANYVGPSEPPRPSGTRPVNADEQPSDTERLLNIARGCHDYGGGYSGEQSEVFHHGIQAVIQALEAAVKGDSLQTRVLESIGAMQAGKDGGN